MTHSDQTMVKRLTGARVRVGLTPDVGPIYRLSSYDAVEQSFTVRSEHTAGWRHAVSAVAVLQAKRDGILHILR